MPPEPASQVAEALTLPGDQKEVGPTNQGPKNGQTQLQRDPQGSPGGQEGKNRHVRPGHAQKWNRDQGHQDQHSGVGGEEGAVIRQRLPLFPQPGGAGVAQKQTHGHGHCQEDRSQDPFGASLSQERHGHQDGGSARQQQAQGDQEGQVGCQESASPLDSEPADAPGLPGPGHDEERLKSGQAQQPGRPGRQGPQDPEPQRGLPEQQQAGWHQRSDSRPGGSGRRPSPEPRQEPDAAAQGSSHHQEVQGSSLEGVQQPRQASQGEKDQREPQQPHLERPGPGRTQGRKGGSNQGAQRPPEAPRLDGEIVERREQDAEGPVIPAPDGGQRKEDGGAHGVGRPAVPQHPDEEQAEQRDPAQVDGLGDAGGQIGHHIG